MRARALRRASELLGRTPQLRKISGAEPPPVDVFLKAVDVIADAELEKLRNAD